jgi:hypothetical protein
MTTITTMRCCQTESVQSVGTKAGTMQNKLRLLHREITKTLHCRYMTQYESEVIERAYNISQHIWNIHYRLEMEKLRMVLLKRQNEELISAIEDELQRLKCIYSILMCTVITKKHLL